MSRILEVLLEIQGWITKSPFRLVPGGVVCALEFVGIPRQSHPAATASGRGFENHRKSNFLCQRERVITGVQRSIRAGEDRHLVGGHRPPRLGLVSHQPDGIGRRAYERKTALPNDFGEMRILGQKAVTRMDRVGARDPGRRHHRGDVEVRACRIRGPDTHRLVGELQREGSSGPPRSEQRRSRCPSHDRQR